MLTLNNITSLVADPLHEVKQIILNYTKSNIKLTNIINKYILIDNGKMVRPLLLLLFSKVFNFYNKDCITLAAAIQLIHMATLLHDDVLDNTNLRRNKKTVNARWGNQCAILAGDFLYSRAFQLIVQIENQHKTQILSLMADTTNIMVEGELLQLSQKYDFSITEEIYLQIITYKTARLFATTVRLPNMLNINSGDLAARSSLNFGLNFGIAYQLLNDMADYYNCGNDIAEGRITLPVIFVLNSLSLKNNIYIKQKLVNLIKNYPSNIGDLKNVKQLEQLEVIRNIIIDNGGFEYTINLARKYLIKAKNFIIVLPDSKYKQAILRIVDELLLPEADLFKCSNYYGV